MACTQWTWQAGRPACSLRVLVCAPAGGKEGEKKEEVGKGKQQIIESKRRLYRVKHRTDQDVTSVRVAGDERENQHRVAEEQTRQVRGRLLYGWGV